VRIGKSVKKMIGTPINNESGVLAGSQIVNVKGKITAVAVAAQLGAFSDDEIRKLFDKIDQAAHESAGERAHTVPISKTADWSDLISGNSETVTLYREVYKTESGNYCRELKQRVRIDSCKKETFGMFCGQPAGSWKITS
jgi:surface antigen